MPRLPPMEMRERLRASFDISKYPPPAQVILTDLKKYGMILADNGSDWFISGALIRDGMTRNYTACPV